MYYTVDRIENEYVVLIDDNKETVSVKKELIENANEGNVYFSQDGQSFKFSTDETEKRKQTAVSKHRSLFDKAKNKQ